MTFENIKPEEFKDKMSTDEAVVLDVRTPVELSEGYIDGYTMINFNSPDFMDNIDKLDKDKTYLIYCRSGNRSGRACQMMSEMGFNSLYNLEGGIKSWNSIYGKAN